MKKVIAIVLTVVLIAGGLGGFAYAQDSINEVQLDFHSSWIYKPPGDIFTQSVEPVTGERKWFAAIEESAEPVYGTELSLTSDLPLEWLHPEPETMAPPTYRWSFGDVSWAKAGVGFNRSEPFPVTFFPGFDASRTIVDNKTVFLQSEGTQTQTLNITVTPRDSIKMDMGVQALENELVNPVITSPTTDEEQGIWLSPDGHELQIRPPGLVLNTQWSITITIDVTPKVPKLDYRPFVEVHLHLPGSGGSGEEIGSSSFSHEVPELGTWTWSTTGICDWHWRDWINREVHWDWCSREIVEPVPPIPHEPMIGQKLVGHGAYGVFPPEEDGTYLEVAGSFTVTNPDCVSEITVDRASIFDMDGTIVYEGDLFSIDWEGGEPVVTYWTEPLKPHEQRWIEVDSTMIYLRDQGYWEGDHIFFTVEIFWSCTDKEGLALIGWAGGRIAKRDAEGHIIEFHSGGTTQMVNMEQVLEPEKEVTTLRLQTWFQTDDPFMVPLENFANTVNSQSDLVRIELYPESHHREIAEAIRRGDTEMGLIYSAFLHDSPSLMDATQLPFLYNNEDGLMAAVQAGIGDLMTEQIKDMTVLGWTTTGMTHLYSRLEMVDDLEDVDGLKIRSMNIPAQAIEAWGGHSLFIPWAEVYQALAGEVIDGAIHSPSLYKAMKFYEVAPYFCEDYFFAELAALAINSDVWKDLDENTQQIITTAAGAYVDEMLATVKDVDTEALERINGYEGVTVYTLTPEERAIWREASQPIWDNWVSAVGKDGEDIIAIALPFNPLPEIP